MKRIHTFILILFSGLLVFGQEIPVDPNVRIGTLDNGLKYYIKHNKKPENKVEFRLAINAGSILEDEDQLGLAHFMEHMNFNGTKNFPDNKLVDYLQSIGVKFGNHLNAYTSFDETVYILPIPLDKPENLENGLKVIEDWAFNALLTDEQIDKERGVVLEELRLGLGADKRMLDEYLPKVLYKSHYADRLPIGKKDILENFNYEALRRFKNDWYRPNLMAVIVVGDIDVDDIEKRIKKDFGKYKNPKSPRERKSYDLPNHKETLVSVASDKDASFSRVQIMFKDLEEAKPTITVDDYRKGLMYRVFGNLINNRLQEIADSSNPPFNFASVFYGGGWARGKNALQAFSMTQEGNQKNALEVILAEMERAKQFGFTESEMKRAKDELLSSIEKQYNERNSTNSDRLISEYVRNFLEDEPIPGIAWEFEQYKKLLPTINLSEVNNVLKEKMKDENRVIVFTGPDKENIVQPKESEVLAVFDKVSNMKLEAYNDEVTIESLITNLPKPGKVESADIDEKLGVTTWVLSNGAIVKFKKTDFKEDEVRFAAISKGGSSLLSDNDYIKTQFAYRGLEEAGINSYSKADLNKYMAGKVAEVSLYISGLTEGLNGSSTPKDLETLFQLTYSYFTGLNNDEEAFNGYKEKQSAIFNNLASQPQFYFLLEMAKFQQKGNPRFSNAIPLEEDWKNTDYKMAYKKYKERFSNAADFDFYFVGNFDEKKLKEYSEKYLATLPAKKGKKENFIDHGFRQKEGQFKKVFKKGKDPKSQVNISYYGDADYNLKDDYALEALGEILSIKLIEELRESEAGVYGAGANGGLNSIPTGRFRFNIRFPCGPENVESLMTSAKNELQKIIDNGPEEKDLKKFKEGALNDYREDIKENRTWMRALTSYYRTGKNQYKLLDYEKNINALTASDIKDVARKYLTNASQVTGVLMPEDGWESKVEKAEAATSSVSAQTIIDNYIKAIGGKAKLSKVKSIQTETKLNMMGQSFNTKESYMDGNVKSVMNVAGKEITTVFNGNTGTGYMMTEGQKSDLPEEAIQEMKSKKMIDALGMKIEDYKEVQSAEIDGKKYNVLISNDGLKSYFDAETGLKYKEDIKSPMGQVVLIIQEYQEVDGIKFPKKVETEMQGFKIPGEMTVTLNQVSASTFE